MWIFNKLRLSYGVTGNNNVGDYVTIASATGPSYVTIDGKEMYATFKPAPTVTSPNLSL